MIDASATLTETRTPVSPQEDACFVTSPLCSGTRSETDPSSLTNPHGHYTAKNVRTILHGLVTHVDLNFVDDDNTDHEVSYTQSVTGCMFNFGTDPPKCADKPGPLGPVNKTFTHGHFIDNHDNTGSIFITAIADKNHKLSWMENQINKIFGQKIRWCPKEKYFVVEIGGLFGKLQKPFCKLAPPGMVSTAVEAYPDTSE